jgi:hypothetical protein
MSMDLFQQISEVRRTDDAIAFSHVNVPSQTFAITMADTEEPGDGDAEAPDSGAGNEEEEDGNGNESTPAYDWSAFYDDEGRLYYYNR